MLRLIGRKSMHKLFFEEAIAQARKASARNEIPIGAVLVKDGAIIASAFNETERQGHFLAHAEVLCIQRATKKLGTKYLNDCELFVTLEPCKMCRAAAALSRIKSVFYLTKSIKFGTSGSGYQKPRIRKKTSRHTQEATQILSTFFKTKRNKKR